MSAESTAGAVAGAVCLASGLALKIFGGPLTDWIVARRAGRCGPGG